MLAGAYEQFTYDIYKGLEITLYFLNIKFGFTLSAWLTFSGILCCTAADNSYLHQ